MVRTCRACPRRRGWGDSTRTSVFLSRRCAPACNTNANEDATPHLPPLSPFPHVSTGLGFLGSAQYLWLNYHTVHHLFPHTDMSKHPAIQQILMEVCDEFGIIYCRGKPLHELYMEMLETFRTPRDLFGVMAQLEM